MFRCLLSFYMPSCCHLYAVCALWEIFKCTRRQRCCVLVHRNLFLNYSKNPRSSLFKFRCCFHSFSFLSLGSSARTSCADLFAQTLPLLSLPTPFPFIQRLRKYSSHDTAKFLCLVFSPEKPGNRVLKSTWSSDLLTSWLECFSPCKAKAASVKLV